MHDPEPDSYARCVAALLRRAINRQGYTNARLADIVGWSQSRLSRVLAGKRPCTDVDVAVLLTSCGATTAEVQGALSVTRASRSRPVGEQHCRLPQSMAALVDHHAYADRITEFAATALPVPLQTRDYAKAVRLAAEPLSEQESWERIAAQDHLIAPLHRAFPPDYLMIIQESALRVPVGGPTVMALQLHHLVRLSTLPFLSVRVVPTSAGAHAGMAGSFTLLEAAESRPVVVIAQEHATVFVEDRTEVEGYRRTTRLLSGMALTEDESRELIGTTAVECFGSQIEPQDAPPSP